MADSSRTQIILGVLTLIGVIGGALIANWDKFSSSKSDPLESLTTDKSNSAQSITVNSNVQIQGSNNIVNSPLEPTPCRDRSHGVERYARTFEVGRSSNWMGGGYSQDPWCNDVISTLRGENPEATFEVIDKSEAQKNTCAPFNCPQYKYYCKVRINTDPIYFEMLSSACI